MNDKPYWHSPCYAIYHFRQLIKKEGVKKSFARKRELETYICALTLLAVNYEHGSPWWLQVPNIPENDFPDVLGAIWLKTKDNVGELDIQEIEVFRIENFKNEKIPDAVKRKLKNKAYPKKTVLIGLINRDVQVNSLKKLSDQVIKLKPIISSIWIVGNIDGITQSTYLVTELFPKLKAYKIDIDKECERLNQPPLMRTTFSFKPATIKKSSISKDEFPLLIPSGFY